MISNSSHPLSSNSFFVVGKKSVSLYSFNFQYSIERCSLYGSGGGAEAVVTTVLPVDVEQHKLLEAESLHVGVVDDIEAEVEQIFVESCLCLEE